MKQLAEKFKSGSGAENLPKCKSQSFWTLLKGQFQQNCAGSPLSHCKNF